MTKGFGWLETIFTPICLICLDLPGVYSRSKFDRLPKCSQGYNYFRDFMKCDASLHYCFSYDISSCVGPSNWACVDALNRRTGSLSGGHQNGFFKRMGLGNTRCCGGRFQSPIDIPAGDAVCDPRQSKLTYFNSTMKLEGTLNNNGVYLEFKVNAAEYNVPLLLQNVPFTCTVPGSSLYVFTNVHFHVGKSGEKGSEHLLNGKRFDGELHLVHVRRDFWQPIVTGDDPNRENIPSKLESSCASQTPLGIAVIGIFLSVTEGEPNEELNRLLSTKTFSLTKDSERLCPMQKLCDDDLFENYDDDGTGANCGRATFKSNRGGKSGMNTIFLKTPGPKDLDYLTGRGNNFIILTSDGSLPPMPLPRFIALLQKKRKGRRNRFKRRRRRPGRAIRCFCRRLSYKELFLFYAKRGEELQCREVHHSSLPALNLDGTLLRPNNICKEGESGLCSNQNKWVRFRPGQLLPSDRGHYQYFGSLTTPPCSEVVNWIVMKTPLKITKEQLKALQELGTLQYGENIGTFGNARPDSPVNDRVVTTNMC